ncbi:DUF3397 family protein [Thermicanus aegyptius]|uniref:DUF3397 family protein n=1 Tax=Thermicanus aegyptius TaxID=94009 RepID=UPI0004220AD0|nr:DUF3397 family protein [Thermicanus aegyptius]
MIQFLTGLYGFFATFPFISFFLIYGIAYVRTRNKKESLLWAVYITFILLLSAVGNLFKVVTGSWNGFWWLLSLLLLVAALLLFLQWKKRGEILPGRVIRSSIFFGFLLFSLSYLILFIAGILLSFAQG